MCRERTKKLNIPQKLTYEQLCKIHPIVQIYPSIARGQKVTPVSEVIDRLKGTENYQSLPFIDKLPFFGRLTA